MEKNKEINVEKIATDAANYYERGDFFCSEAIVRSFNENLKMNLSDGAIRMASGFPVGLGKSKCLCGAVSGGSMILSYFFGRSEPKDPKVAKCLELNNEIVSKFKERNRVTCCSILTKNMDMASGEHKEQCVRFTYEVAKDVAEILKREL